MSPTATTVLKGGLKKFLKAEKIKKEEVFYNNFVSEYKLLTKKDVHYKTKGNR